jgi:hypothetical protein
MPTITRTVRRAARRCTLLATALTVVLLAACEHPIAVVTPHVEAADVIVRDSLGVELARTAFNRTWSLDTLVLQDGAALAVVPTALDFRDAPIDLDARGDVSWRVEAEDGALLQWEPQRGFGWLRPFARGTTRVRFIIWHQTHADFVSPWLPVTIRPADAGASSTQDPTP